MQVGTNKSKEIKKYFIKIEKIFKFYIRYQNEHNQYLLNLEIEKNKNLIDRHNDNITSL